MSLQLFAHPFSSYCQKALIALYENHTPFKYRTLEDKDANDQLAVLWPLKRFPVLVDDGRTLPEASIIIEHLAIAHPGPVQLIPASAAEALEVRLMDRFFDNYISTPQQRIVFDSIRPAESHDAYGVNEARTMLDTAYRWLDRTLADGREWACGAQFSMADCAAAPALFYADWTHAIAPTFANVHAYRRRLLARPSFARAVDEARPFRAYFPLGAPDRD
jgi:glutathione S-transferase